MQLPKRKLGKYGSQEQDFVMTKQKYEEFELEVKKLKSKKSHAAREVSRLAELGDFSENVEYQLAKRRLRGILGAITKIEHLLKNAEVISSKRCGDVVMLGCTVTITDGEKEKRYTILGSLEVDPAHGIISHNAPIGIVMLRKKVGDIFVFHGVEYRILNIE